MLLTKSLRTENHTKRYQSIYRIYSCLPFVFLLLTACGSSPGPAIITTTVSGSITIKLFNQGTQDPAFGTKLQLSQNISVTIPPVLHRTEGQALQNSTAAGVDFAGITQCYYTANTHNQNTLTLASCTNGYDAGLPIHLHSGQTLNLWSYVHVNSDDSEIEMVLSGALE